MSVAAPRCLHIPDHNRISSVSTSSSVRHLATKDADKSRLKVPTSIADGHLSSH